MPPRERGSVLRDPRLAGYNALALCAGSCKGLTKHLVLRHQLECKRCFTVRKRRAGDPPPPA